MIDEEKEEIFHPSLPFYSGQVLFCSSKARPVIFFSLYIFKNLIMEDIK